MEARRLVENPRNAEQRRSFVCFIWRGIVVFRNAICFRTSSSFIHGAGKVERKIETELLNLIFGIKATRHSCISFLSSGEIRQRSGDPGAKNSIVRSLTSGGASLDVCWRVCFVLGTRHNRRCFLTSEKKGETSFGQVKRPIKSYFSRNNPNRVIKQTDDGGRPSLETEDYLHHLRLQKIM